ncbi:MAG: histidine kinase dimerization/phosphoacceptor domain -containing protein [Pseudomonadota bacterium]
MRVFCDVKPDLVARAMRSLAIVCVVVFGLSTEVALAQDAPAPNARDEFNQDEMWDAINADPAAGREKAMAYLDRDPPLSPTNKRRALNIIGVSYGMQGRMDEALEFAHRALDMAIEQDDYRSMSAGWTNIGLMEQARGQLEATVEAYANAIETSKKANEGGVANNHTLFNFGALVTEYGRPNNAIDILEQARTAILADQRPTDRGRGLLWLARAYRSAGRMEEAKSEIEVIKSFLDLDESAELTAMLRCEEALIAQDAGAALAARSFAQSCLTVAEEADLLGPQVDALIVLGQLNIDAGDAEAAKAQLETLTARLDRAESAIAASDAIAPAVVRRRLAAARLATDIAVRENRLEDALRYMNARIAFDETLDGIASKAGSALGTLRFRQEINTLNVQLLETEAMALQTRNMQQRQFIVGILMLAASLALLVWIFFRSDREKRSLNEALRGALKRQKLMNLDMQHRVRNNLQILLSLLSPQLREMSGAEAVAVKGIKSRIVAMGALYSALYSEDASDIEAEVDAREMLHGVIDSVVETYGANDRVGAVEIDNIHIDKATASPLGLLVAELVSNVFKHTASSFSLSLKSGSDNKNVLTIADQGAGFSPDVDPKRGGGLAIVEALARQIEGTLEHSRIAASGNQWTLEFPNRKLLRAS